MNAHLLERHFAKIGARAKLRTDTRRNRTSGVSIDIGTDRFGEFFDIAAGQPDTVDVNVVDAQPRLRHLVLMSAMTTASTSFCAVTTNATGSLRPFRRRLPSQRLPRRWKR